MLSRCVLSLMVDNVLSVNQILSQFPGAKHRNLQILCSSAQSCCLQFSQDPGYTFTERQLNVIVRLSTLSIFLVRKLRSDK